MSALQAGDYYHTAKMNKGVLALRIEFGATCKNNFLNVQ